VEIELAYGKTGLKIDLPDDLDIDIVEPGYIKRLDDASAAIEQALLRPLSSKPLRELAGKSNTVGIVINDSTRPTPYKIILPVILRQLRHIPDEQIVILNATGTHRPNTQTELKEMLGEEISDRFRIIQNDARAHSSHRFVGRTQSGNDIWLHNAYLDCDVRILTGFIEPHFFAGFSGGGKAVMPGLALLETILRNHSAENMDHPQATWGVTDGNPIWEEIQQAVSLAPPSFLLNVTLNKNKDITGVFAGDFRKAYEQGCTAVRNSAIVAVKKSYDIVITSNSGYPLDLNLYQSIKSISAASRIVKDGGVIITAADCWDGIPEYGEYAGLLREAKTPESLLNKIRQHDCGKQDMWQAQVHALVCLKANVYFHSHNLTDAQIESAFFKPCASVEETVEKLLQKYGGDASICILPDGTQTIPYIAG